ncbi:MAG: CHASE domain-containing protein [Magnetococcales bacterium]|nr:CHASE domain-containing protein [Magnetococcales bacterium]
MIARRVRSESDAHNLNIFKMVLACFLAGFPSLLFSLPPTHSTVIHPASGVALAGLLLWGWRLWPGVFLGIFFLGLWAFLEEGGPFTIHGYALAVGMAVAGTLQAVLGYLLARRLFRISLRLDDAMGVARLFLIVGPGACLLGASVVVWVLWTLEFVQTVDLRFTWWTWWVGESLGIFFVLPLMLIAFGTPRSLWRGRGVAVGWPLVIAAVVLTQMFAYSSRYEADRLRNAFREEARVLAHTLESQFDRYLEVIWSLEGYFAGSQHVSREEFKAFVRGVLPRHPGIQAISWNPRILNQERAEFEARVRWDFLENFEITEKSPEGLLVPAGVRDEYIVVNYIEPLETNRSAVGFDVASTPERKVALDMARDSGQPVATAPINLVQNIRKSLGVLVFLPIYRWPLEVESVADRRNNLLGFGVGVFRLGDVIRHAFGKDYLKHLEHVVGRVYDVTPGLAEEKQLITIFLRKDGAVFEFPDEIIPLVDPKGFRWNQTYDMRGRVWRFTFDTTYRYRSEFRDWGEWMLPLGGLLFSGLLAASLLVITGRTHRNHELARQLEGRKAALERSNIELEQEIHQRQEAEDRLRQSEERFRGAFEGAAHGMALVSPSGHLLLVNQALCRMTGYGEAELLKMDFQSFTHPEDLPEDLDSQARIQQGEIDKYERDKRCFNKEGQAFLAHLAVSVIRGSDGAPLYSVFQMRDITQERELEARIQSAERLASVGRLAAGLAHEVNNPLASASINLQGLKMELEEVLASSSDARHQMAIIERSLDRSSQIAKEVLAFSSQGDQGFSPLDLNDVLESALQLVEHRLEGIVLHRDLADLPDVAGLYGKLEQVCINLLNNALDACPEEGGVLHLTSFLEEGCGVLTIRDNGCGIPEKIMGRVMVPFFTTKRVGDGTGLGLAVCYGIVTQHRGELELVNHPEGGVTATVRIPLPEKGGGKRVYPILPLG